MRCNRLLPFTIARALGCLSVKGFSLVPKPAARIMALLQPDLNPSPDGELLCSLLLVFVHKLTEIIMVMAIAEYSFCSTSVRRKKSRQNNSLHGPKMFFCIKVLCLYFFNPIALIGMLQHYIYLVFIFKVAGHLFGCINASMLAAGTAKINDKAFEISF